MIRKISKISLAFGILLFSIPSFAQTNVISGIVKDQNGDRLEGISVQIQGTNSGGITDSKGRYNISAPGTAVLVFSGVGFTPQTVEVNNRNEINITMEQNASSSKLNDVIVIGYGTQKKSDITGAVSTISSKSFKDQPVTNVASALQGRASGISVSSSSGAPGGAIKIRIRGANSINSSNEPLYVVDGVALGSIGLQDIDVNDIASMEVLKDASATAIYGSRGANGVILITTKRGHNGNAVISYNTFVSVNSLPKKYDILGPVGYAELVNHIDGTNTYENPKSLEGTGTDWQNELYQNGITQNHQLSISGGTEKSKYYISGYYVDQTGIIVNTSEKKFSLRSNIDTKISNKLSVGLNIFASHSKSHNNNDLGGIGNPVISTLTWPATQSVYDSGKEYHRSVPAPIYYNPYMLAKEKDNDGFSNSALVNANVRYDITDWLSLTANLGLDANFFKWAYLNNKWISPTSQSSGQSSSQSFTLQNSDVLTFHKVFGKIHDLTATAIYEQTSNQYQSFAADGSGLSSTTYGYYNLGLNSAQGISSDYSNWALQSYVGRISYSLKNKYLLTATYRADGSSKFQNSKNKWGYFPSAAVGWRLSEEPFLNKLKVISNLKLRASYGVTGNQGISPYSTLGLLSSQQYSYGTGTLYQGYTLGNPPNPDLKWETTYQEDIGLDLSLLSNRINVTADYFNKNTKGLLLQKTIPDYDGGGAQWVNLGEVNNKGFELSVNVIPVRTNDFSWSSTLNISTYRNRVVDLGDQTLINVPPPGSGFINTNLQIVKVGQPLGTFYLIPWNGIYQTDDNTLGYKAGDNKYADTDGNGSIGYEDRIIAGSSLPKYQWAFNNDFTYKRLSLNLFIQASQGNKIFNGTYAAVAIPSSDVKYPTLAASANYWTPENKGSQWADPASKTNRNYIESTQFLQNGSYVRLKNLSVSYLLVEKLLGLGNISLSLSGQNLVTITKYKGYDPEADTMGNNDSASGIDLGAYPNPKTYTVSLNVKF